MEYAEQADAEYIGKGRWHGVHRTGCYRVYRLGKMAWSTQNRLLKSIYVGKGRWHRVHRTGCCRVHRQGKMAWSTQNRLLQSK